jgi:lipopolysaccharide transport system permease protein
MRKYLSDIWATRHFWTHLARAELRARFRRSRLGLLWALLQPLLLTMLMAFVFGTIHKSPIAKLAPWVFSGILVWGFICASMTAGCTSLLASAAYIRQRRLPLAIYPLKSVLAGFVTFLLGIGGLVLWVLATKPGNLGLSWVTLLISFPLLFALAWPLAIIAALINTKFQDFQQAIGLILQAVWYLSPIFLRPEIFRNNHLGYLVDYNPVAHLMNLVRAPMLYGKFPEPIDYVYSVGTMLFFALIAAWKIRRQERNIIFYL